MRVKVSGGPARRHPRRARGWALIALPIAALSTCALPVAAAAQATFGPSPGSPPSGIGNEAVYGIAVSPAYEETGLVAVMSTPISGCKSNCQHLWVSHDGGASWSRAAATGWDGGRPLIAVDSSGHEVMFTATSALERSADDGQTWSSVANLAGISSLSPNFAKDGTIAVAGLGGTQDHLYRNGKAQVVTGSGGAVRDQYFMLSPAWPSPGTYPPALLAAADPNTSYPIIQRCNASLACSGATSLSGSQPFSAPATLIPSSDYAHDGAVFAQTGRGVYKSTNGGLTFTPFVLGQSGATTTATPMMALAPGYRESGPVRTAYVAVFQAFIQGKTSHTAGGIYRTRDGGASWAPLDSPGPFDQGAFGVDVAPDGRLFGGYMSTTTGHAGLLCSTDGGASWKVSCPSVGVHSRVSGVTGTNRGGCGGPCSSASGAGGGVLQQGAALDPSGGAGVRQERGSVGLASEHKPGGSILRMMAIIVAVALAVAAGGSALIQRRRRRVGRAQEVEG